MSFEGAVDLARTTFGDDIVFQSRFVSILDDFGAFRTKPSYKHILRILISASEFTHYSRYNCNEKIRFLTTITNSYGLNEDQVKTVLHKLFPSNDSIISCERNSKDTDKVNPELIILIDYSKESTNASQSIEYFLSHLLNRISNKFNKRGEIICKFRCNEIKYIQFGKEL